MEEIIMEHQSSEKSIVNDNVTVINEYKTTIQHASNVTIVNSVNEYQNAVYSEERLLEETVKLLKDKDHDCVQPLIWMEDKKLENVYIPPVIREEEVSDNISEDNTSVTLEEIVNSLNETCSRIQIDGEAGSGKTTLAKKLIYDWSQRNKYMEQFTLVIHVPLSDVNKNNSIENVLLTELAKEDTEEAKSEMKKLLLNYAREILFLLDGLNDLETEDIVDFINKFKKLFILSKFILFSRPLSDKVKNSNSLFKKKFYLYGFNESCIDKYIYQFFSKSPNQIAKLREKIILNGEIKKICGPIPLFWHLVCILYEDNRPLPFTVTELYHAVIVMFSQHYCKKNDPDRDLDETEIPDDIQHALKSLGKMVFACLQKKCTEFSVNKLEKLCGKENSKIILDLGILKKKKKSRNKLQYLQPVHVTFLEFVVAFYLSKISKTEDLKEKFKELFSIRHLLHSKSFKSVGCSASFLIVFLCGLLKKKRKYFFCELKEENLYKSCLKLSFLLWEASGGGKDLKKTITDAAELLNCRIQSSWDINWLFEKERKLYNDNVNVKVLEEILKNSACQIRTFSLFNVQLYLLNQNEELFKRFLLALESNETIEIVHIDRQPDFPSDFPQEQYLNMYRNCFKSMEKMKSLHEITLNIDIFCNNKYLSYTVLLKLFNSLNSFKNLEMLHIKALPKKQENLCTNFHEKTKFVSQQIQNKKAEFFAIKDDHINSLIVNLKGNQWFKKLYLPQVICENMEIIQEFSSFLGESAVKELQLSLLQIQNEIEGDNFSKVMDQLLITAIGQLTYLDLQRTSLSYNNSKTIALILNKNKNLKSLNLAHCFQGEDQAVVIFETLCSSALEQLNMASDKIVLQNDTILKLKNAYVNIAQNIDAEDKDYHLNSCSNLKAFSLSGWSFQFKTFETLESLAEFFSTFAKLEKFCLNSAEFRIHSFLKEETLLEYIEKILIPSSHLELVDLTSFKLQAPSHSISLSSIDSGIEMSNPLLTPDEENQYLSYFTAGEQIKNENFELGVKDLKEYLPLRNKHIKFCFSLADILNASFP